MQRDVLINQAVKDLQDLRQRLKMSMPEEYDRFCRLISENGVEKTDHIKTADFLSSTDSFDKRNVFEMIIKYIELTKPDKKSIQTLKGMLQKLTH